MRVYIAIIVLTVAGIVVGFLAESNQALRACFQTSRFWVEYSESSATKADTLAKLSASIGYTGFIHNFKNYVLRHDLAYLKKAQTNYHAAADAIRQFEALPLNEDERQAIGTIADTMDQYRTKLLVIPQLVADGDSIGEIDRQVEVDDTPAAEALADLHRILMTNNAQGSSRVLASIASVKDEFVAMRWTGGLALLALCLFAAILARAIRSRLNALDEMAESQKRFADFADVSADWLWELDEDKRYTFVSGAFSKVTGLDPDSLLGRDISIFKRKEDSQAEWEDHNADFAARRAFTKYRYSIERPSGDVIHIETSGKPIFDSDGTFKGYRGTSRDITELVENTNLMIEARRIAEHANRAKSEFLASMSHELRTPLNAVLGFGQMLEVDSKTPLADNHRQYVASILEGGNQLLRLVDDILDLARVEAQKTSINLEYFDPGPSILACVQQLHGTAKKYEAAVNVQLSDEPGILIWSDVVRFKQVFINILSNAIKYGPFGGTVEVRTEKTEDGFLRTLVSDTGPGIPPEKHDNVFELFDRGISDPTQSVDGVGIGLAVSKMLIGQLGGRIDFASSAGEGTTFWFDLPLAENNEVLIWNENLRVGVDQIDSDHQKLFALINRVSDLGHDEHEIAAIVDETIEFISHHFRREEAIMTACSYPDLDTHIQGHRDLEAQIRDRRNEWKQSGHPDRLHEFREFLRNWWWAHIRNVDSTIGRYAEGKEHQVSEALSKIA